ncbi:hypothetical protein BDV96DRAFT_579482 [Lophiotrema nucula]|uniref:Uncharacterized protein n=1 Tax=Lophiotrema nucula TaxID=690887 RepID=A0A6A5Z3G7_9PLEO|nr:hypothetical protein BDV96DRAFT_579482 [Lophiotrema nucula]
MPDANSFNDSAYASSTSFTESSDGQSVSVQTGRPLLDTGLFIYKKEPNAALLQHYERVHEAIEGILIDEILAVDGDPDRSVSIRVEVAGRREHEASLHLIIFCAEYITKRFRTAFRSDHMKTILQPRRSDIPGLLYVIIPVDPEELCSPPQFLARTRRSSISERITFCGEALNISCGAKSKNATFGGTIKVDLGYGEPKFYGMTVGHAVEALRGDEVGLNTETTCAGHCSSTAKVGTGSDSTLLGEILLPTAYPGISSGAHVNSHDWALFPLDKPLSNKVLPKHTLLNAEETAASDYRSILIPKYPTFHDHVSDPVIMMGGVSGFSRGELSSMPARLWSGKSKKFIDTYTMELEQGKVSRGDSGAWVIHNAAPDFYGHTVARDPLGDAYVVPAPDTLKNIQECLGAVSVQLPNEKDDKTRNNPLATNLAREYKATAKVPKNKRFVKEWPERFTEIGCERPDRLKSSWVKELRKKGGDFQTMDCLDLFLYDGENSLASISAEDIRSFCDVPEQDPTVAGESRRAWLVDRNDIVSEEACQLSAKELYQHLETIGPVSRSSLLGACR